MAKQTVFVTARVVAEPGFIEPVKAACRALVGPSRRDAGCVSYELFESEDAPNVFIFFEEWETKEDVENHLATAHAAAFDEATAARLLEDEEIVYLRRVA